MKKLAALLGCLVWIAWVCTSCVDYSPKPRGYFRIEPSRADYRALAVSSFPFDFNISKVAVVELPENTQSLAGFNLFYPELSARIYCSYLTISPQLFPVVEAESRSFISRQLKPDTRIDEKAYTNADARVFGSLFLMEGETASPVQFYLTDSVSHFFRGALYFDCKPNVDSLAPVVQYVREDIIEMIQTFRWKK